jgi:3-hydroxyacyl-[acyl-carrier-protein] dehydratase
MTWIIPDEMADSLRRATREPLIPASERRLGLALDRAAIEALLPHRGSFLLIDRVTALDLDRATVAARYELRRSATVFQDHFPGRPVWPGVLQVEAIGQAGAVLLMAQPESQGGDPLVRVGVALTHVLAAKFLRPIPPQGDLEVLAHCQQDGLFVTVIGQCLHEGAICSVAAVKGLIAEEESHVA